MQFTASCGDSDPCTAIDCAEGYECVNGDCILIDVAPWDDILLVQTTQLL